VRLIPFTRQFSPDDDPDLQDTLRSEAAGILRWAVEGARLWFEEGLRAPASVLAAGDEWRTEADPLAEFIAARCVRKPDAQARSSDIYAGYQKWADAEGLREKERLTATAFGRRMGARFVPRHTKAGKVYEGVGLLVTG
jgi:putative DNA primase/helicase